MAKEKMMNEARFSRMVGEFDSLGELIKARQDEKQSVMDEFDKERARHRSGKISEKTVESSARKTNREMTKLNGEIRNIMSRANKMADSIKAFVSSQSPKVFRAHVSGIVLSSGKKVARKKARKATRKKVTRKKARKVTRKKVFKTSRRDREIALDKKYQK
jgi:hypothetical protein